MMARGGLASPEMRSPARVTPGSKRAKNRHLSERAKIQFFQRNSELEPKPYPDTKTDLTN